MLTSLKVVLSCALAAAAALPAAAQQYPNRPITVVVPFSPGGTSDITARPLAQVMGADLGQSLVIENRPGAGGGVGMAYASRAKPDGYTLLMALPSISIIPASDRVMGRQSMYLMSQLEPIARITADPTVFAVNADSPWKTLDEFVQAARKQPGKITYSSSGVYGTTHVAMEMFTHAADIKLLHVPYSGGGLQVTAVLRKEVDATTQALAPLLPHVKSGRLRVLAVWGSQRLPTMPDLPSVKELGYDVEFHLWTGLFAPAGTPEPILKRLRESVQKAVRDPGFAANLGTMQTPLKYLDAVEFKKFLAEDSKRLEASVMQMGKLE